MSNSAINTQVAQLKVGNVQNQADSSSVYSNGVWSFKNSTAATAVTITNAGNVGISTTNPSAKLHVDAGYDNAAIFKHLYTFGGANYAIAVQGDTSVRGYIAQNPASGGLLLSSGSTYYGGGPSRTDGTAACHMSLSSDGAISFATNSGLTAGSNFTPTERMRIDASGNLAIAGTASTGKITITQNTQADYQRGLSFYFSATSYWNIVNGASSRLYFGFANGVGGYTDKAYVDPPTGAWTPVSDARAKKNIETISYGLNDILQLNPVKYNMNEEDENTQKHLGFIAQEVKQVIAEAVTIPEDEERLLGLDKTTLIPVLVKAIQELSAKVDAQAEEIKALKAK